MQWDAQRQPTRLIGTPSSAHPLQTPVALAADRLHLYVADAGAQRVAVFDRYGTFVRIVPAAPLRGLRTVAVHNNRLWIITRRRVLRVDDDNQPVLRYRSPRPLIDAAPSPRGYWLLTARQLLHVRHP